METNVIETTTGEKISLPAIAISFGDYNVAVQDTNLKTILKSLPQLKQFVLDFEKELDEQKKGNRTRGDM